MKISFTITGEPKGQPRCKATTRGKFASVYTPKTADTWKALIHYEAKRALSGVTDDQKLGPINLSACFSFSRPVCHRKSVKGQPTNLIKSTAPNYRTQKPDLDNLVKALMDALTNAGAFHDDAQVINLRLGKMWVVGDSFTAVDIEYTRP